MDSILNYFSLTEKVLVYTPYFLSKYLSKRSPEEVKDNHDSKSKNTPISNDISGLENNECSSMEDESFEDNNTGENDINVIELLNEIHSTSESLNDKDFMKIATKVNFKQAKLHELHAVMTKVRLLNSMKPKQLNMVDYQQTLKALRKFETNLENFQVAKVTFYPKIPEIMAFLKQENLLLVERTKEYINICKEKNDIDRRLADYKSIDISGLINLMNALQETQILSVECLARYKKLADESKDLSCTVGYQCNKMQGLADYICNYGAKYHKKWTESEVLHFSQETMDFFTYCWENVSSELTSRELFAHFGQITEENKNLLSKYWQNMSPKLREEVNSNKSINDLRSKTCKSEHKIPLCRNCGWRNSWLKAFKKRGVYVKDDVRGAPDNIWHNK